MEPRRFQIHSSDLGVGDLDAEGIRVAIDGRFNAQSLLRRRGGDEADDDLIAEERFPTPVALSAPYVEQLFSDKILAD